MITLTYDPVMMSIRSTDRSLATQLFDCLKADNPEHDESDPDSPPFIEFFKDYTIPTGLLTYVLWWCETSGVPVTLKGFPEKKVVKVDPGIVPGIVLAPFQVHAVETLLYEQRGVLEIATGGGKTEMAIALTLALGVPRTIFMVPDQAALFEMYSRFVERGLEDKVGMCGAGDWDLEKPIVIGVVNSLYSGVKRSYAEVMDLLNSCVLFFSDECHHQATAWSWQVVASSCRAQYRIGMSGTPYKEHQSREDSAFLHPYDSMLRAMTGDTLVSIRANELIRMGFLTDVRVATLAAGGEEVDTRQWHEAYGEGIVNNEVRNARIVTLAANLADMGYKPLISIEKLEHGRVLQRALDREGITSVCSYGSGVTILHTSLLQHFDQATRDAAEPVTVDPDDVPESERYCKEVTKAPRKKKGPKLEWFEKSYVLLPYTEVRQLFQQGIIKVLIGSRIYDECLNIRFLTDTINAAGGKANQRLRQKIGRVLRRWPNKNLAMFWEPQDESHVWLTVHSRKRLDVARGEDFRVISGHPVYYLKRLKPLAKMMCRRLEGDEMKIKGIGVEASMVLPLAQNGTALHPKVSLTAELDEGEDEREAYEKLSVRCTGLFLREAFSQQHWMQEIMKSGIGAVMEMFVRNVEATAK